MVRIILLYRAKVAAATHHECSICSKTEKPFPHLYIHVIIARLFYLWSVCNMCLWCEFVSLLICFIEFLYMLIANV